MASEPTTITISSLTFNKTYTPPPQSHRQPPQPPQSWTTLLKDIKFKKLTSDVEELTSDVKKFDTEFIVDLHIDFWNGKRHIHRNSSKFMTEELKLDTVRYIIEKHFGSNSGKYFIRIWTYPESVFDDMHINGITINKDDYEQRGIFCKAYMLTL